jgi:DUF917 family protein
MWALQPDDLESIAIGAGILGTGGGGNPYLGKLKARRLLRTGHRVEVMSIDELADDALVVTVGGVGAPTIGIERIDSGTETYDAVRTLEEYLGRRFDALIPAEIGGGNSIEPMIAAAQAGVPVIDGDGMGRAFPEIPMLTYFIYGVSCFPCAIADVHGNRVIYPTGFDGDFLERLIRSSVVQMGGHAGLAIAVMSGADVKRTAVRDTLSLARDVGARVRAARSLKQDAVEVILDALAGRLLFTGKLVDVDRTTKDGWVSGLVEIEGLDDCAGRAMTIAFRNENLIAWEAEEVVATVPDLICIVHLEDGEPITTELLRYGHRVAVIGVECSPLLRTPEALAVVGPAAFGYDVPFRPLSRRAA